MSQVLQEGFLLGCTLLLQSQVICRAPHLDGITIMGTEAWIALQKGRMLGLIHLNVYEIHTHMSM